MTAAATTTSFDYVRKRNNLIEDALDFVQRTRDLEEAYGRQEQQRSERLDKLEKSLQETDLRIVVVGEYSRGKSMLLNALVGNQILPTNDMQTTAINTFMYGTDEDEEPHIELVKRDGSVEKLPWEENVIEKWGTALSDKDAHEELDRIHAYSDHELLKQDLVLIDTPGFEGIIDHHEEIARDAMNEAHVAIWVQATDQLGGNAREWEFVQDTISKNFDKFLTVINKWDRVLEPANERERQKPVDKRIERRLDAVRENFREECSDVLSEEALEMLISDDNLFGVSAHWGLSDNLEKQQKSNIQKLADRIEEMCKSAEGAQQILAGPLRSLKTVHERLLQTIEDELDQLQEHEEIEDIEAELRDLDHQIETLELELERELDDIEHQHDTWADRFIEKIESELVQPLDYLAEEADLYIKKDRIRRRLESGDEQIGLPRELEDEIREKTNEIEDDWQEIRAEIEETLEDLAKDFQDNMSNVVDELEATWTGGEMELSTLELEHTVDLGAFEEYQRKLSDIESEKREYEEKLEEIDTASQEAELESLEEKRKRHEQRLEQLEARRSKLGPPPEPRTYVEKEKRDREGVLGSVKQFFVGQEEVEVKKTDRSNVKEYRKEKSKLDRMVSEKEQAIQDIIDEYQEKHEVKISREKAKREYKKKLKRKKKKMQKLEEEKSESLEKAVEEAYEHLHRSTVRALRQRRDNLSEQVADSIQQLFDRHCEQLEDAVREQYMEPLQTKRDMRSDKKELMNQKESKLEERREELESLKSELETLIEDTKVLDVEVEALHED